MLRKPNKHSSNFKKSVNLSGFLQIENTQKITHKRLIEHEQKLDECLLEERNKKTNDDGKR